MTRKLTPLIALLLLGCPKQEQPASEAIPSSQVSAEPVPVASASAAPTQTAPPPEAPKPPPATASVADREGAVLALLSGKADLSALPVAATDDGEPVEPNLRNQLSPRKQPPRLRMPPFEASPGLPKEVIQRILRQRYGQFRACYERGLARNPNLEGKLQLKLIIDAEGAVKASAGASSIPDQQVTACILNAANRLRMPKPEGGQTVRARPTLEFAPAG